MKAALLEKAGRIEIREVPTPVCPEGGVLLRIKACGICGADAKMTAGGHRALVYPRIPGHEISGIISESRTDQFKAHDRVQVSPGQRCGRCRACVSGRDNQCEKREIFGFTIDGGFAEYLPVPLTGPLVGAVQRIPSPVSFAEASLAEPLACCINAQDKTAVQKGDTVLIMGGGPLGLLHCMTAASNGADAVWIVEPRPERRKAAIFFGASRTFDPADGEIRDAVREAAGGRGVDVILLACPQAAPDDRMLSLLARGGRMSVFSGISPFIPPPPLDVGMVHYNELTITGAYGCTADQNLRAMHLIASGNHPFQDLITHRTSLSGIRSGLAYTENKKGFKSIMEVNDD